MNKKINNMKKISLTLIYLILLYQASTFSQSGWIKQYLGNSAFHTLHFFNDYTGYAASYDGILYKTTNGGINWTSSTIGITIYNGYFFNDSNYVLVGHNSLYWGIVAIFQNNIRTDYTFYPQQLDYLYFSTTDWLNVNTGFVGGVDFDMSSQSGYVIKTTNRGVNWINVTPSASLFVNDIKFINSNTGYLLDPYARRTTNEGVNWVLCQSFSIGGNSISIPNPDTMYIVGNGTSGVFFSSNAGFNWITRWTGFSTFYYCINFLNTKTGWACGNNGYIIRTNNSAESWQKQDSKTLATLRTIQILDSNRLWIGGDSGVILKTTTGGLTFAQNISSSIPDKYILYQNYPNPFNPNTKIRYEIPRSEFVKIAVYNALGQEVKVLVNKKQSGGNFEVNFDGSNYSSGVYFYKFFAGDFVQVKKMVLIK